MNVEKVDTRVPNTHVDHSGWRHALHHWKYIAAGWILSNFAPFPLEHWVWENVPVLRNITEAMGL